MTGSMSLATNFGTIEVGLGRAPRLNTPAAEAEDFRSAMEVAGAFGYAVLRRLTAAGAADVVRTIVTDRKLPFPNMVRNFAVVRPMPEPRSVVFTKDYLAFHSDNANHRAQTNYIFMFMERSADAGGESLVVGHRELGALLDDVGVEQDGIRLISCKGDRRLERPIFARRGARRDVTYSPFASRFEFGSRKDFLAFSVIARAIEETIPCQQINLHSGDAIVIDNRSCLHGRLAFVGDRVARRVWFQ